jgi:geranylgeranyl pyrophosphate synthase
VTGSGAGTGQAQKRVDILEREQGRIEKALVQVTHRAVTGLPDALRAPVEYALSTTGKRIRPVLCTLAYAASGPGDPPPAAYRLACSLEIVHTYSLIHDDLPCMDDDALRRGRPTVHTVYGVTRAVAAGAALLPMAVEVLEVEGAALGLDRGERAALVMELARAAGAAGMVGGQLLDLESEQRVVDAVTLESIHRRKTGALLTSSLRIGALAGRAGPELLAAMTVYGEALGLAFQITDDLLDVEGTAADVGKTTGRDLALRKASYPAHYGSGVARDLARRLVTDAKRALAPFALPELAAVADFIADRRK